MTAKQDEDKKLIALAKEMGLEEIRQTESDQRRKPGANKVRYPYVTLSLVTDPVRARAMMEALKNEDGVLDIWTDAGGPSEFDALESKLRAATGGVWIVMPSATETRPEICSFGDGPVIVSSDENPEFDPGSHQLQNAAAVAAAVNKSRAQTLEIQRLRAEIARRDAADEAAGAPKIAR